MRRFRGPLRVLAARAALAAAVALAVVLSVVAAIGPRPPAAKASVRNAGPTLVSIAADAPTDVAPSDERPVYQHSVVLGGVYSQGEAMAATARDIVVANHYQTVAIASLRLERVGRPRLVHVSYRVGDRVLWTRHKVALDPDEYLLTDGVSEIRARCGNRIAETLGAVAGDHDGAEHEILERELDFVELDPLAPGPASLGGLSLPFFALQHAADLAPNALLALAAEPFLFADHGLPRPWGVYGLGGAFAGATVGGSAAGAAEGSGPVPVPTSTPTSDPSPTPGSGGPGNAGDGNTGGSGGNPADSGAPGGTSGGSPTSGTEPGTIPGGAPTNPGIPGSGPGGSDPTGGGANPGGGPPNGGTDPGDLTGPGAGTLPGGNDTPAGVPSVPEPVTLLLFSAGLAVSVGRARRGMLRSRRDSAR